MVTIKQLSEATGYSPSTVSIVLRGKGADRAISKATIDKIFKTATELGYQPNIAARSLRGGQGADTLQVAVFWAQDFRAGMMVRFLEGLRREIDTLGRSIRLVVFPYDNDDLSGCSALVSSSDCHAAIICNASAADMEFLKSSKLPLPVVLYNRASEQYCTVNVDDVLMGALAARAFASAGCRRAAILTGPLAFEGMAERIRGFCDKARALGMETLPPVYCESSIRGGVEAAERELLHRSIGDEADAVFCSSSVIGLGVLRALRLGGVDVPERVRVISIGNGSDEQDAYAMTPQSVVYLPMEDMAGQCLRLLLDVISGAVRPPCSRMLPVRYIARKSCGPIAEDLAGA